MRVKGLGQCCEKFFTLKIVRKNFYKKIIFWIFTVPYLTSDYKIDKINFFLF